MNTLRINCILLIDDSVTDTEFHALQIRKANVCNHLKFARDGQEALDYIIKSSGNINNDHPHADLIYLDVNMPRMDAFQFLHEYSGLDLTLKAKAVILMPGSEMNPAEIEKIKTLKIVDELQIKPLLAESVTRTVQKYFG